MFYLFVIYYYMQSKVVPGVLQSQKLTRMFIEVRFHQVVLQSATECYRARSWPGCSLRYASTRLFYRVLQSATEPEVDQDVHWGTLPPGCSTECYRVLQSQKLTRMFIEVHFHQVVLQSATECYRARSWPGCSLRYASTRLFYRVLQSATEPEADQDVHWGTLPPGCSLCGSCLHVPPSYDTATKHTPISNSNHIDT